MNNEILYQSNEYSLISNGEKLIFNVNNISYYLESQPYEPCLFIKLDNKIISIIHNSFNTFEIEDIAKNSSEINAITGKKYDVKGICELLACAISNSIYDTDISYLEKQLNRANSNQIKIDNITKQENKILFSSNENDIVSELTDDVFYEEYKKYDDCVLDYCIIKINSEYNGEDSHKKAVLFAMSKWAKSLKDMYDIDITIDVQKLKVCEIVSGDKFFLTQIDSKEERKTYCNMFLNPPQGCNYTIKDFEHINNILFPKGYENLEILEWSTNWSNYFKDGLEWWGTMCASIYDKKMDRFVVIGASATD